MVSKPMSHGLTSLLFTVPVILAIYATATFYNRTCKFEKAALQHKFDVQLRKVKADMKPPPEPVSAPAIDVPREEHEVYLMKAEVDYNSIWMSELEVNLVLRYLNKVDSYLEWGSGGSTFNFPKFVKRAVSIEHDEKWCGSVKQKLAANPKLQHVEYHCVPVARGHMGWGIRGAFEEGNYTAFKEYIDEIDNIGEDSYQMVLVDGRARVDATIKALSYIRDSSYVVLHDASRIWGAGRYSPVTKYYAVVDSIGGDGRQGIAVLKRKAEYKHLEGNREVVQKILNDKYGLTS